METLHTGEKPVVLVQHLDDLLLQLTEQDPSGLLLLQELCREVELNSQWTEADRKLVYEAAELADFAHKDNKRGHDEYFGHPVRVALRIHGRGGTPEQVAAGLLHDTAEDNPLAVIRYLSRSATEPHPAAEMSRHEQIERAISVLYESDTFGGTAPYIDTVTNRPYPHYIDISDDTRKHTYRAEQIRKYRNSPDLLLIKDCDNSDNTMMLTHHEALNEDRGNAEARAHLRKLIAKYSTVLEELAHIQEASGGASISRASIQRRRAAINRADALLRNVCVIEVETPAA